MMMSRLIRPILIILGMMFAPVTPAVAGELTALARLDPEHTGAREGAGSLIVDLSLTQAVPYRVFTLGDPYRLVLDFREVDWSAIEPAAFLEASQILDLSAGLFRPGWSRLVLTLDRPMEVDVAGMQTDPATGGATVRVALTESSPEGFAKRAGAPASPLWGLPEIAQVSDPIRRQAGDRALVVVLDPGHGGIDPGAQQAGASEAHLMLQFALVLKEALLRTGDFEVVLTREDDGFVPLERRVSIARAARADVFLSLHADALSEGRATGTTIYTLSESASDAASARLAERHNRADLLAGVDLTHQDDVIAGVLMDLARTETAPRSDNLADTLVAGIHGALGRMYKHPRQNAGFSVLKAPDIPSVLIELGFMSSPRDLEDLQSPEWRLNAVDGIVAALEIWAAEDAAAALLIRQ